MSIVADDLLAFNALNRPEDDSATGGGGRDDNTRPDFTQIAGDDDLEIVSANAGDTTQDVTIDGRDAGGSFVTEVLSLNGTTPVLGSQVFERILSITMDGDAAGAVTLDRQPGGANVYVIPIGERGASATFIKSASSGSQEIRYDKIFWRNAHATLNLTTAKIQLTADPASRIRVGIHTSKDDTATITNRKTAPGGITFVDDSVQQDVPGGDLEAVTDIGVWIEQDLPASDPPVRSTYTLELAGNTT